MSRFRYSDPGYVDVRPGGCVWELHDERDHRTVKELPISVPTV